MKLLQINEDHMHRAEPTAEARAMPVFAEIIKRDRGSKGDHDGRYKQHACRELAWIYHMVDFDSPYFNMSEEERDYQIRQDLFEETWEPDETVLKALETYKKIRRTPSMKLLEAANSAVGKLEEYLRDIDLTETDPTNGKPIYSAKDLVSNLEKLGKVVDGLSELKKQVEKEQAASSKTYGDMELNEFNR